ncbi:MAG: hypothetical protein LBB21_04880 [Holosporaceae bacterium]|jgi:hypothetical protein|nr:hypothetical protein [Holosporaceae bacterium]
MRGNVDFCANCAANMFQSISQNRSSKRITVADVKNIACISFLPFFGGGESQYEIETGPAAGRFAKPFPHLCIFCIKGTGNNMAQIKWAVLQSWGKNPVNRVFFSSVTGSMPTYALFSGKSINVAPCPAGEIAKGLEIEKDEIKILMQLSMHFNKNMLRPDGVKLVKSTPLEMFGLYFLKPEVGVTSNTWYYYFAYSFVFTPKPGLFDDDSPS